MELIQLVSFQFFTTPPEIFGESGNDRIFVDRTDQTTPVGHGEDTLIRIFIQY